MCAGPHVDSLDEVDLCSGRRKAGSCEQVHPIGNGDAATFASSANGQVMRCPPGKMTRATLPDTAFTVTGNSFVSPMKSANIN
jgi:hypothetical protein